MENRTDHRMVAIHIRRSEHGMQAYEVPYQEGMNLLSALRYIYENLDRTLAYLACLCRSGKCGACAVRVNGKAKLGCAVALEEGMSLTVEPISETRVIKDLICKDK